MKEPAPLPDDLRDYLAAEREPEAPARATRERMLARLGPFLPPTGGLGGGSTGGLPSDFGGAPPAAGAGSVASAAGAGASAATGALQSKLVVAAIAAAVGAGGGAATHAMLAAPRPVPVFVAGPMTGALSSPMEHARAAASAEVPGETAPSEEPAASATSSARGDERARPAPASLRAERLLIETANAALLRGDPASALAALRKHQRSYPKGELAQERELLLVQALKASGDDAAAEQRARDFKQKFPGSMQQEPVDKASRPR